MGSTGRSLWLTKTAFFWVLQLQICYETMDLQITELILAFCGLISRQTARFNSKIMKNNIWILATFDVVGHLRYRRSVTTTS
jgi:hypothetical protein